MIKSDKIEMMAFKLRGNKIKSLRVEENVTGEMAAGNITAKSDESWQSAPESLSSFMEDTTLHGARFLFTGNVFRRLFWTLALMLSFGYCVYQVYQSVDSFDDRPFHTKITTKTADKAENLPFPAVTLCNYNYFNKRKYMNFVQKVNNWTREDVVHKIILYEKMLASSDEVFSNISITSNPELIWRYNYLDEHLHYLVLFSHRIEEMLLPTSIFKSCIINGEPCESKNFTSFYSSAFGQCYTFNSGHNQPIINATMAGQVNGLKLLLNVERDSYLDNPVNPMVGITVLVHDQKSFPVMEQFGFAVQPGLRTLCAIKRKKV